MALLHKPQTVDKIHKSPLDFEEGEAGGTPDTLRVVGPRLLCRVSLWIIRPETNEVVKSEFCEFEEDSLIKLTKEKKRRRMGSNELLRLGVDSNIVLGFDRPRLRDCRNNTNNSNSKIESFKRKKRDSMVTSSDKFSPLTATSKRWVRLNFDGADPKSFIGLPCKVYWPMDAEWYSGRVIEHIADTNRYNIEYEDGDKEDLVLSKEKVKFFISREEMERLNLIVCVKSTDGDGYDYNEMVVLAASLDDCQDLEPGDIIWAKLTGSRKTNMLD
ncbi:HISTONE-LYSINE N-METHYLTRANSFERASE ATX2 [Salix koriyanagi]|uniref:HISTONE-LYSINE N-METHYLTRANSFERASE ATX2 n=1 Tax=Salix koriyanagi TaxID=2511006 RepID=A0A9Q0U565_9ROSI|nr:HISTONE-LYSINE N-METHYLTRANSFERASE ATX2 [Salix koriyanagi]